MAGRRHHPPGMAVAPVADAGPELDEPTVFLRDGSSIAAEVVVGADGACSTMRRVVSDVEPVCTRTCFATIQSPGGRQLSSEGQDVIGRGTIMAVSPGLGILVQHNADGNDERIRCGQRVAGVG
ncbi:hypothetical protein [Mycolicibacterium sp.]|uniref:hypothetical protein n=1 Tax=Mycolicibacterium sp. TaxID=2320850 RepID=UPI001A26A818|nr:hypothetical protein [Mycolicibacterium sp.]MBJ7338202.1 hypothetical protein [Mycolicibacterium sp.]